MGHFHKNKFHINNVTGPDEYTVLVNDNYYTNSMAKYHFESLIDIYQTYKRQLKEAIHKLQLKESEIKRFQKAANQMTLGYDKRLQIYLQDDSFMQKAPLDYKKLPNESFPLILHYHPLFIYKHQILKQADTLLSMFLLDYEDDTVFENSFEFYLPKTTHESSLSKCIHSIVAFRVKKLEIAYDYLHQISRMDLENTHKNTHHGLHIANSGGIYLTIVQGILGLRIHKDKIVIRPSALQNIEEISVRLTYKGSRIEITLNDRINVTVEKPLEIGIYNDTVHIEQQYHCDYK